MLLTGSSGAASTLRCRKGRPGDGARTPRFRGLDGSWSAARTARRSATRAPAVVDQAVHSVGADRRRRRGGAVRRRRLRLRVHAQPGEPGADRRAGRRSRPTAEKQDPSTQIAGVQVQPYEGGQHVDRATQVAYTHSPPFGGAHDDSWAACNGVVYPHAGAHREPRALDGARRRVDRLQPRPGHRRRAGDAEQQGGRPALHGDVALPRARPADLAAVLGPPAQARATPTTRGSTSSSPRCG